MTEFPLLPDWVAQYCAMNTTGEPPGAEKIRLATLNHPKNHWLIGPALGTFLRILMRTLRPMSVLELGTFTGYSTAFMLAEATPTTVITSIERDLDAFEEARRNLAGLERGCALNLELADGLNWLEQHPDRQFDLVFIDIDRSFIADNFEAITRSVALNGILICDNALLKNKVVKPVRSWELQTAQFNQLLSRDPRFISSLLPVRDGLNIALRVA